MAFEVNKLRTIDTLKRKRDLWGGIKKKNEPLANLMQDKQFKDFKDAFDGRVLMEVDEIREYLK